LTNKNRHKDEQKIIVDKTKTHTLIREWSNFHSF